MTESDALGILHLARGASPAEIRRAYLDLVKVWHPDRFQSDARLRDKAQRTLQRINEAYTLLERGTTASETTPNGHASRAHAPEPGPAERARTTDGLWNRLHSRTVIPVCAGLALGVALSLTLILRSTRAPAAGPVTVSPPPSTVLPTDATSEPAAPAVPNRPRPVTPSPGPESGTEIGPRGPAGRGALSIRSGLTQDGVVE